MGTAPLTGPDESRRGLEMLGEFGTVLSIKLYRLALDPRPEVPIIPCLDHEAMLHETVAPHVAAYVQEHGSGDLHEVVLVPGQRQILIDTVSTWGESSPESHRRLRDFLARRAPGCRIAIQGPSRWRGERRVAAACRAQVSLLQVLLDPDMERVKADIERLRTVSTLMEKESRVASWGVRTITGPVLAAAGVLAFLVLGTLTATLGDAGVTALRYALLGLLGTWFLYYGLKAVQLTGMANRAWKRAAEYGLILTERKRLAERPGGP